MQLIYAGTLAILLGVLLHAVLPAREHSGALLLPAVAGAGCAAVWAALTWAGLPEGGAAMWAASLVAAVLAAVGVGMPLRRSRRRDEQRRLAEVA